VELHNEIGTVAQHSIGCQEPCHESPALHDIGSFVSVLSFFIVPHPSPCLSSCEFQVLFPCLAAAFVVAGLKSLDMSPWLLLIVRVSAPNVFFSLDFVP
jgi:hypothetical protein